jgi:hypothetical protein
MCVIWMESRQQALAMAKTYTFMWDASHKTSWLGLKYFDFCTIGDMGMLELLAQGLQRHEDNATSLWILDHFLVFTSVAVRPLFGFIDVAPECIFSCTDIKSTGRILGSALDEWHNNQNYNENFYPLLDRDAHGFISRIHSLQYDDDIRTQLQIYVQSFGNGLLRARIWRGRHMGEWCSTAIVLRDQRGRRFPRPRRLFHEQTSQQRAPVGQVCPATCVLLHLPYACASNCAVVAPSATR